MKCYNITKWVCMSLNNLIYVGWSGLMIAVGILSSPVHAATHYPLQVDNCGFQYTYQQPPNRVVTIGQHETELMLALGLEDKIVGTSVWFGPLPDDLKNKRPHLYRLADNAPGFEAVVKLRPDFVAAQYTYHVGKQGEVATRDQFAGLGIPSWISPSDCVGKGLTEQSNSDGARQQPFDAGLLFDEITTMAQIFDVVPAGTQLIATLKQRIESAKQMAETKGSDVGAKKVVFWFSSARLQGEPWVAGNRGAPAWIARTLGLDNIIDSTQEWPSVGWEMIARQNPDYIVIAQMDRRLYPADDAAKKMAFLRNDPVTSQIEAVKNDNIIVVPAMSLNPSLRNVNAVEMISQHMAHAEP